MLRGNLIKQLTYYPLIASLLLILVGYSTIDRNDKKGVEMTVASSRSLSTTVNVSQTTYSIDEKKALDLVWKLPQVKRKAREIERLSRGSIRVAAAVDSLPTSEEPYYVVRVLENHPDKSTSTVYWFRVLSSNGAIEALDWVNNKYISLEKWNPDGR